MGLVAEIGKALGRILGQVGDINTLVADIAAGAQEQSTGLAQVNTAIHQMDQVTQQNAAMVEETTAAGYALAEKSSELDRLIDSFKLGERVARQAAPTTPARRLSPGADQATGPRRRTRPRHQAEPASGRRRLGGILTADCHPKQAGARYDAARRASVLQQTISRLTATGRDCVL